MSSSTKAGFAWPDTATGKQIYLKAFLGNKETIRFSSRSLAAWSFKRAMIHVHEPARTTRSALPRPRNQKPAGLGDLKNADDLRTPFQHVAVTSGHSRLSNCSLRISRHGRTIPECIDHNYDKRARLKMHRRTRFQIVQVCWLRHV